jgi:UDP-galactose transporter B1
MGGHGHGGDDEERHAGYGWLLVCVIGMMSSLTMYGIVLEYATSGGRKLHELSFVFVTTSIYALTAFVARGLFGEKPTQISKYQMLTLSLTSIASTFTSVRSLRYVIYPVQVLFKSCKPVPVMIFGIILGKKYPLKKYVNVVIITTGVALFMGGGSSTRSSGTTGADSTLIGALMLSVSLCFDGATGAYEDKLMAKDSVEPFDLMYNIQLGKAVISFVCLVITNGLPDFIATLNQGGMSLIFLGLTGALGQVFVFVTISKFGALNCALIGLARKMLSLLLSFVLYGHTLNAAQTVGLALSLAAMIANFYEKGGSKNHGEKAQDAKEALPHENVHLLSSSEPTGDVDVDTDELVSRNQRTPSMADDVERKMGDLKLTAQYSNRSSKKSGKNELEPPLSEVDLLSFGEDGKQSDYLDLPLAKDENHSTV